MKEAAFFVAAGGSSRTSDAEFCADAGGYIELIGWVISAVTGRPIKYGLTPF